MKTKILSFLLCVLFSNSSTINAQFVPPVGIPDPDWGQIHPINSLPPSAPTNWPNADAAGFYYVDSGNPSSTDSENPFGSPNKPRKTIPSALAAGAYVAVVKCSTKTKLTASGSVSSPVWLVGVGAGVIQPSFTGTFLDIVNSSYLIVDGIVFDGLDTPNSAASAAFRVAGGSRNVSVRNCTVRNMPVGPYNPTRFGSGGAAAWYSSITSISPDTADVSDVVIFGCSWVGNAGGQNLDYESGRHCILSAGNSAQSRRVERVWILNNIMQDNPEDGIQIGESASTADQTLCRFFYIGGNHISNHGENAIDLKACDHIVVSRNLLTGFRPTNYRIGAVSGSDGSACVINDDGKGPLHSWWLFNTISDSRCAWRNQAAGGNHYFVGNLVHDLIKRSSEEEPITTGRNAGVGYQQGTRGPNSYLVGNTFYRVHGGIYLNSVGFGYVRGNIVADLVDHTAGWPININNFDSIDVGGSVYFDPNGNVRRDANALHSSDFIDIDPLFSNPLNGDFTLRFGSPALAAALPLVPIESAYAQAFGKSINLSFDRAQSGPGPVLSRPAAPTAIRISP